MRGFPYSLGECLCEALNLLRPTVVYASFKRVAQAYACWFKMRRIPRHHG